MQNSTSIEQYKKELRQQMRQERKALSSAQQLTAGNALLEHLKSIASFNTANSIALYLTSDGEIDPISVIEHCWSLGKRVYLPVLDPDKHNQLLFVEYRQDTPMCFNKYQISEPATPYQNTINADELDLVLLPLVAFDQQGSRMGMGGGYYDRSFAFINTQQQPCTPVLIGLAHALQQVSKLNVESWDIPLTAIVTDGEIHNA
ncbi:MAG: 5-formyltetrahydrofolate cyclo-ligase [Oceanospirillaceae bacterium]